MHEDSVTLPQNSRDVLGGVPPRGAAQVDGFLVGPHVGGAVVVPGCGGDSAGSDRGAAASGVQFRSTVRLPTMVRARSLIMTCPFCGGTAGSRTSDRDTVSLPAVSVVLDHSMQLDHPVVPLSTWHLAPLHSTLGSGGLYSGVQLPRGFFPSG